MANTNKDTATRRWAHLRFCVVGPLLAAPPARGELQTALRELANKTWTHPTTGEPVEFAASTLERWYYAAKNAPRDPVGALDRKVRKDAGEQPSMGPTLRRALKAQYRQYPGWTVQLHYDNLVALAKNDRSLGEVPSYTTVRRYMNMHGLVRRRPPRSGRKTEGTERAARRLERFEVRSYEATHVGGLWHTDFHSGSLQVLLPEGRWHTPQLFGMLDDRSRLGCHAQWYLDDTTEAFVHGMLQGYLKYDLPRALMSDNGSAMKAAETLHGLLDLGIIHERTLVESPYQNGKQESFWTQIEGRLLPMLEDVEQLTLEMLNEATHAWLHMEYNKKIHEEIGCTPLQRFLEGPSVLRPCPDPEALRLAFRRQVERTQRRSDGTVSIEGIRFEIPSRFRQIKQLQVRYAVWDLSRVHIVDPQSGQPVARIFPLDKARNADGRRRQLEPVPPAEPVERTNQVAPLLAQLMKDYAATGLPPAYLPRTHDLPEDDEQ
ncbi:MAG: IS481 family transposase [Myxococcota bacterium]